MLGSIVCRALLVVFGYIYPAYQTYKTLERGKPDVVRTWLIYWCGHRGGEGPLLTPCRH